MALHLNYESKARFDSSVYDPSKERKILKNNNKEEEEVVVVVGYLQSQHTAKTKTLGLFGIFEAHLFFFFFFDLTHHIQIKFKKII